MKQVLLKKHFQYYTVFHLDRLIRYCKMWIRMNCLNWFWEDLIEGKLEMGIFQKELMFVFAEIGKTDDTKSESFSDLQDTFSFMYIPRSWLIVKLSYIPPTSISMNVTFLESVSKTQMQKIKKILFISKYSKNYFINYMSNVDIWIYW